MLYGESHKTAFLPNCYINNIQNATATVTTTSSLIRKSPSSSTTITTTVTTATITIRTAVTQLYDVREVSGNNNDDNDEDDFFLFQIAHMCNRIFISSSPCQ